MIDRSANLVADAVSTKVRIARVAGICLSWLVWIVTLVLAIGTDIGQGSLLLLGLSGFVPYLLSMHVIEPWLNRERG
jgi:hypothetical protein